MTADPFAQCISKIDWAKQHITELDKALASFIQSDPYTFSIRRDQDTGDIKLVIDKYGGVPDSVCNLSADLLHALMSALDYLARQLVITNHQEPSQRCGFPIFLDYLPFLSIHQRMVKGMSPAIQADIKALQPFNPGPGANHPLWILRELNNTDKHNILLPFISIARPSGFRATHGNVGSSLIIKPDAGSNVAELKEGTTLDLGISADADVDVQPTLVTTVFLPVIGDVYRYPANTFLGLADYTEAVVTFFRRRCDGDSAAPLPTWNVSTTRG